MDPETLLHLILYSSNIYFILLASPEKQKKTYNVVIKLQIKKGSAGTLQQLRPITAGPVRIKGAGGKC